MPGSQMASPFEARRHFVSPRPLAKSSAFSPGYQRAKRLQLHRRLYPGHRCWAREVTLARSARTLLGKLRMLLARQARPSRATVCPGVAEPMAVVASEHLDHAHDLGNQAGQP